MQIVSSSRYMDTIVQTKLDDHKVMVFFSFSSADETGARWCYLPVHGYSTCTDVGHGQTSSRFPGRQWSYEACATPPPPAHGIAGCIGTKDGAGCQDKYEHPAGTKAASPYQNFGCQCDSLTFLDKYGSVQGNCKR